MDRWLMVSLSLQRLGGGRRDATGRGADRQGDQGARGAAGREPLLRRISIVRPSVRIAMEQSEVQRQLALMNSKPNVQQPSSAVYILTKPTVRSCRARWVMAALIWSSSVSILSIQGASPLQVEVQRHCVYPTSKCGFHTFRLKLNTLRSSRSAPFGCKASFNQYI